MTAAGGVLATSVTLRGPSFTLVTFAAGSTPPAWAQALITNPKAWESAPAPTPEGEDEGPKLDVPPVAPEVPQEDAPPAPEDAPPADAPEEVAEPEEDLVGELPEPPKRGAGSGRDAWVAYANSKNVEFEADAPRDDIIAAVEAAFPPAE